MTMYLNIKKKNPYSMNAGDGTKFSIKYGYYGNNSYKKELNFNP